MYKPDDYKTLFNIVVLMNRSNLYEESIKYCNQLLNFHPTVESYLLLGRVYQLSYKFDEEYKAYEKIVEIDPKNSLALAKMGYIHLSIKNEIEKAETLITKALLVDPNRSDVQFYAGLLQIKKGQNDLSVQHFMNSLNLNKGRTDCYVFSLITKIKRRVFNRSNKNFKK